MRIERQVEREAPFTIRIDGEPVIAHPGETIATAMLTRSARFRDDGRGQPRGLFCNMGTCSECMVTLLPEGRRLRACLVPAQPGMEIIRG